MLDTVKKNLAGADFVMHLGVTTCKLVIAGFLALLMVVGATDNTAAESGVACSFARLEPDGGSTSTVLRCGDSEQRSREGSLAGWAWQNRERELRCDITSTGRVLRCALAE